MNIKKFGIGFISALLLLVFTVIAVPTVVLLTPIDGQIIASTFVLNANGTNATSVSFYTNDLNGTLIGTDNLPDASGVYSVSWDTTTVVNGFYNVTAIATDGVSNVSDSALNVVVNNPVGGGGDDLDCDVGDLDIIDSDFDDEVAPGETLNVEVEVENDGDDLNVVVELVIFNNDEDDEEASKESEEFDLDEDESEVIEISIKVPDNLDENDDFDLVIRAFEDGDEDEQCTSQREDLDVEREEEDVRIERLDLSSTNVRPGGSLSVNIEIENFGSDDQEDMELTISNSELRINERATFDVDESTDPDNDFSRQFVFVIPNDARSGSYTLEARLEYDDGGVADSETRTLSVTNGVSNVASDALVSVSVVESNVEEVFSLPVLVTNNEKEAKSFVVSLSSSALEGSASKMINLAAGKSGTVYLEGSVKEGVIGLQNGVLTVESDGNVVKRQTVSFNVLGKAVVEDKGFLPEEPLGAALAVLAFVLVIGLVAGLSVYWYRVR
ncbi:MAG: putative S-layer protein [Candidatus Woesearchaeota archaeon]|nr:MAG: putative S-layer protein [Candidatus Woesearchaeota archaeon]